MAIIINTDSKNGADNIDVSRQKTNKSNLVEAINLWKDVIEIDEKKYLSFRDFRSVKKDLQILLSKLEENAIVICDDYNINHYGVRKAVDEIKNKHHFENYGRFAFLKIKK